MTTIQSLSLQGIRSYSDEAPETIHFFKPLTVIQGANGSGKTTIIEALKYVTTGSLPPLSDGGKSFIHDPKLESQSSTKAQIRLTFRINNDSQAVLAIRTFQLTQTGKGRSFKALEAVLRVKDLSDGSSRSMSNRCADMDKLVPQLMGVSPAVLESVIFCHQAESDWPLEDSKRLKLKFDDIFAATRYTKALEAISKLRKDKINAVKLMEAELKTVDAHKEVARRLKEELAATTATIDSNKAKRAKLDEEIGKLEDALRQHSGKAEQVTQLKQAISAKESVITVRAEEAKMAFDRMKYVLDGKDDELQRARPELLELKQQREDALTEQEARTRRLASNVEDNDRDYQESVKSIGRHEQQQTERQRLKAELSSLRERMTQQYHVDRKDDEAAGDEAGRDERFLFVLKRVLERQRADLLSHKATVAKIDSGFEESLSLLRAKDVKCAEGFNTRREKAQTLVAHIKELVQRNKDIDASLDMAEHMEQQQQVLELERKMNMDAGEAEAGAAGGESGEGGASVRTLMADKQRQLNSLQAELLVLADEKKRFAHQNDALALIRHKQAQLTALVTKHNNALATLLSSQHIDEQLALPAVQPLPANAQSASALAGREYDSSAIHGVLTAEHKRVKAELKTSSDGFSAHMNGISRLKGQSKLLRDELSSVHTQLDRIRQQFAAASSGEDDAAATIALSEYADEKAYEEGVAAQQARLDKLNQDRSRSTVTLDLYTHFVNKCEQEHHCPMCARPFASEEEERDCSAQLNKVVTSLRSDELGAAKIDRKAAVVRRRMKRMAELAPLFHDYVRLNSKERDELAARAERVRRDVEEAELKAEDLERQVKALTKREARLTDMIAASSNISRLYGEVLEAARGIDKEREKLRLDKRAEGARELEQVSKELDDKERARSRLQAEVTALQERQNEAMRRREEATRRYHHLKGKVQEAERLLDEKARAEESIRKSRDDWQLCKDESEKFTRERTEVREAISKQETEREEQRRRNAEGEAVLSTSVSGLQRDVDLYSGVLDAVKALEGELNSGLAVSSQRELYDKAEGLKRLREERDSGMKQLSMLKDALQSCVSEIAEIDANLDHRRRLYEFGQLKAELSALQRQLAALTTDSVTFLSKLRSDQQQLDKLRTKRAELSGAVVQLEQYANERAADLQSPLYRDIGSKYTAAMIELHTNAMAVKDLDTYHKCLEVALLHYHTVKMREINDLLRDYWRSIYRGHDIEEIFINSAVETEQGKRRTYDYSVMMKQGDTELEMRGRCSAGQRVLASLLIRLALADTFGLTAGFLALDEPTTNLDHRNIAAFASALSDIVEKRRQQSNFQLIVITHDETFVEEMGRRAGADFYYRVTRDPHTHYSRITKTPMDKTNEEL